MLRKIIMSLGVFVALLPYLGFPRVVDNWLFSVSGLLIFFLLVFSKRSKPIKLPYEEETGVPPVSPVLPTQESLQRTLNDKKDISRSLNVSRTSNESHPHVSVEKDETRERLVSVHTPKEEHGVTKKISLSRRRKRIPEAEPSNSPG